ncbi:glycoside hydrolase superfamily, partial [Amylostereum chailletii]
DIDADKVLAAAQSFVDLGLKDVGYEYVNIDDCWLESARDPTTQRQVPNATTFPDGIKGVADQVHSLGLKLGIYSDAGSTTCAGFPGSLGFEDIDAAAWAEWGVDCDCLSICMTDNCAIPANWTDTATPQDDDWYNSNSAVRYRQMGAALANGPVPVQFELCIWGTAHVWEWGARVGHSWRMSGDASPDWNYLMSIMTVNSQHLDTVDFFAHNDMDMMEIGNGNLTLQEERTHFAVWAFMKSPILIGTDLSQLSKDEVAILTNKELLAFSQDTTVGTPATPFGSSITSPPQLYAGASVKGTHVFVVNTNDTKSTFTVEFSDVPGLGTGSFVVHDMWTGEDVGTFKESWSVTLDAHDTAAVLVIPS